jgi:hypothetical protein
VFSAISINPVPVLRSRSPGKDKWLTPTDLIYDKTAGVIRRQESKLVGITDSFQAIAMRNLLRIAIKRITPARGKTNKQRRKRDVPERAKQIITTHFRRSDWKLKCVSKFELTIVCRLVGPLASKIVRAGFWFKRV